LLLSLFENARMPSPIRAPPPAIHHQTGTHGPPPAWHFSPPCACFTPAAPPGAIGPVDEAAGLVGVPAGVAACNPGNGAKAIATLNAAETSAFFTFRPSFFRAPEILYHRKRTWSIRVTAKRGNRLKACQSTQDGCGARCRSRQCSRRKPSRLRKSSSPQLKKLLIAQKRNTLAGIEAIGRMVVLQFGPNADTPIRFLEWLTGTPPT
jgi:hypothetical protein